ncbi:MAG: hypothetical protein EGQ17_00850 [Lachnospiraceae bacterium]|nr:hypothetical protein [Lachnospiraceae bacterium]
MSSKIFCNLKINRRGIQWGSGSKLKVYVASILGQSISGCRINGSVCLLILVEKIGGSAPVNQFADGAGNGSLFHIYHMFRYII